MKARVIVFGIVFYYPLAGVTYQFLHYLLGLRRLGYDVWYVEDSGRWLYDPSIHEWTPHAANNVARVAPTLERYGFGERWCFRENQPGGRCYGMSEEALARLYREADAFLNVTGAQELRDEHMGIGRRIYVESDPFGSQVQVARGESDIIARLDAHDTHFSFGENLGAEDCTLPVERYDWLPTRQPVAMELWDNPYPPAGGRYTTVTSWKNTSNDIEFRGELYYWTKDREFEKFLDLPRRRDVPFELAVSLNDEQRAKLESLGWNIRSALEVSGDVDAYRDYLQRSRAEFTIARDQVVRPRTGWFSDRSASYLGAGRPVITQETGFSKHLPTGNGLFAFETMDDILRAVDAIESDHAGHCRAARELAAEYFGAEKVLSHLMERAGL